MPRITAEKIEFLPEDRYAIEEQSPGITPATYTSLFNGAIRDGDTTKYFKFLEEIQEKDADILHSTETRTSYITSKEWTVEGENEGEAKRIEDMLREIQGDPSNGLLTTDQLIATFGGVSYLTGISMSEIVTDGRKILGFSHIPSHFLTFKDSVHYPRLWTQEEQGGVPFNQDKMISHYLHTGMDPARGWLGNGISWQYVLKRAAMSARLDYQRKYGKGFFLVNMPGSKDSYEQSWATAEELIENYSEVDGAVFEGEVEVDFKEAIQADGEYFFRSEENFKRDIARIILGQESTSSSVDSNRSTASVHMEVLEQRSIEDMEAIEDTMTSQLVEKIKVLLGISPEAVYEFKFVLSDMEETLDDEMEGESATESDNADYVKSEGS